MAHNVTIDKDTYTDAGNPTTNYGSVSPIWIEDAHHSTATNERNMYLNFDLTNIPRPYCNINAISLEYYRHSLTSPKVIF